ncbi:Vacuolar protein sorting-associated protein Ist1 [Sesbania bispinosa]|nr:Vacuolar protein sorting-associated protein Ist1 [Sesbania bispinosa]
MFDILFGWSKASKCKKAIKRARCRLRLLKNKRQAIVRQLRKDLAELIQSGHEEAAINRVEQLLEDESLVAAYELLDQFCEFILTQFSYIRRNKDCPNDINEAVSSLIFASARCGDLPELCAIRKLFGKRYGEKFATTAVELSPGNLVNKQLKENLSGKSVPDDLKYRVVDEIARETCLQQQVLAIQYYPDWQQVQVKENKGYQLVESGAQINDTIGGSKVHPSEIAEIKRDVKCVNSSISKSSGSCYLPESGFADTSAIVSTVQQYPPYILSCPLQNKVVKLDFPELLSSINSSLQNKGERLALESSAKTISFPPYPEEMLDYVDDIEECQFPVSKDGACQDQMLFKFRSSGVSSREKHQFGCDENDIDQDESQSEKSSIRISRRRKRAGEKRSRRRSASQENLGIMDIGYMIYYQKPCRSPSAHKHGTHCHRKHQKPSLEGIPPSSYAQERLMLQSLSEKEKKNAVMQDSEALSMKPKRGIRATHVQQGFLLDECCHCQPFRDYELNQEMELVTIPQKPNRKSYSSVAEYHVFNYPHCQAGNGNNGTKAEISVSPNVSNPRTSGSLNRIETEAPYSRAMTMPQVRHINGKDKMLRTYSCPSQHPNHVHPKLPDYDDIAAKFTALKRGNQENKDCSGDQQGK